MDARRRDSQGRTICPGCGKAYRPTLGERDPNMLIQNQFPHATPEQREELITGYCSTCQKGIFGDNSSKNCEGPLRHFIKSKK